MPLILALPCVVAVSAITDMSVIKSILACKTAVFSAIIKAFCLALISSLPPKRFRLENGVLLRRILCSFDFQAAIPPKHHRDYK